MNLFSRLLSALPSRLRRYDEELDEEIQAHLAIEAKQRMEAGEAAEEAEYSARRVFGNVGAMKESTRESWSFTWLERCLTDLRFAARILRKTPGFTVVAALTLALGIGANTAIFSVVNALLLRPLSFEHPERLVRLFSTHNRVLSTNAGPSEPDLRDFAERNRTFEKLTIYDVWRKNVSGILGSSAPEQMRVGLVSREFFEVLGVRPILGRLFTTAETEYGRHYVAAIGYGLWRRRFGGSDSVLGQKIQINDEPYTIVAVMPDAVPDWMEFPRVEVWTPFAFQPRLGISAESIRGGRDNAAIGRLKANVSLKEAQADLAAIAKDLARIHPIDRGVGVVLRPLADTRVGPLRPALLMLMGAVALILLIACTNLANLLLARNSARTRELVMRVALGAGRSGLVRQLLVETVLLSLIGGGGGCVLAWLGCAALARVHPERLPQLGMVDLDTRVLLFTLGVSVLTGVICGLLPAIAATRVDLVDALKEGGRSGTAATGQQYLRRALVIAEVAFSLMLVAAAGLLIQSVIRLERQTTGFREDHLLQAHFYLPPAHYSDSRSISRFCQGFRERIRRLPGVTDASITTFYPPVDRWAQIFCIEGQPGTPELPTTRFGVTDERYVRTMGIPLVKGRDFSETDSESREPVALINEEFARRYFQGRDPIGIRLHLGQPQDRTVSAPPNAIAPGYVTVVGVIGNFRNNGLAFPPEPHLIALFRQEPSVNFGFKDVMIRTAADPRSMTQSVREQLHEMDPNLPLADVQTSEEYISKQTSDQRFVTSLLSVFAVLGLTLAVVGVYGVVSFLVTQRVQELGIRLALGARPSNVLWLVMKQGMTMGTIGVVTGLAGAAATRKLLAQLVFNVSTVDLVTLAAVSVALLAIAATASAVPGARAMRIDPASALRQE